MNNEIGAVGHPITTVLTYNQSGIFATTKEPIGPSGQATICGRDIGTGSIYVLWYDGSRNGFVVAAVIIGSAPVSNARVTVHYVAK